MYKEMFKENATEYVERMMREIAILESHEIDNHTIFKTFIPFTDLLRFMGRHDL